MAGSVSTLIRKPAKGPINLRGQRAAVFVAGPARDGRNVNAALNAAYGEQVTQIKMGLASVGNSPPATRIFTVNCLALHLTRCPWRIGGAGHGIFRIRF